MQTMVSTLTSLFSPMYVVEVTTGVLHGTLSKWMDKADINGTSTIATIGKKRIVS